MMSREAIPPLKGRPIILGAAIVRTNIGVIPVPARAAPTAARTGASSPPTTLKIWGTQNLRRSGGAGWLVVIRLVSLGHGAFVSPPVKASGTRALIDLP